MKNFTKVLALVLAVVMLLSFATIAGAADSSAYKDADKISDNRVEAVDVLTAIGVIDGFDDKTLKPDSILTREQAAKIIAMFMNGATDIDKIYASANPFTDVSGWSESYVAYCYKTGIIDGVGDLKFAPAAQLTGVQFLKMTLGVLGYDAKAEGMTGKNWDVNTLALAKRAGLTAGFTTKFDFTKPMSREDAIQIMLNALRADTVEYGSALGINGSKFQDALDKWNPVLGFEGWNYNGFFYMTVTGAVKTGDKLMDGWHLDEGYMEDAFMRPYRTWELGGDVIGTYMYPVKASYTTAYDMCDVLVDLGIAKNNTAKGIKVGSHYVNGAFAAGTSTVTGASVITSGDYSHGLEGKTSACAAKDYVGGAQGTLSQVFLMDNGNYRITEIDTWLAVAKNVKKTIVNRDGHKISNYTADLDLAETFAGGSGLGAYCADRNIYEGWVATTTEVALSENDIVLVSLSYKGGDLTAHYITAPKTTVGKFDGFKDDYYPSQTRIDGEFTPDSLHFHYGYVDSKTAAFGQKTFYFDRYNNVIGMEDPAAAASQYLTITKMWLEPVKGTPTLFANVVTMDAKTTEDIVIASYTDKTGTKHTAQTLATMAEGSVFEYLYGFVFQPNYHRLHTFTVNANGSYNIADCQLWSHVNVNFKKGIAEIRDAWGTQITTVDSNTQFLIDEGDGTYTAVTGFKALDTMSVTNAQWIDNDSDGYAEIVYLCNPSRIGDFVTVYASHRSNRAVVDIDGVTYAILEVYIDGVKTDLYATPADAAVIATVPGFYKFQYTNVGDKDFVTLVGMLGNGQFDENCVYEVLSVGNEVLTAQNTWSTDTFAVAPDCKVYTVRVDDTVVLEEAGYVASNLVGQDVMMLFTNATTFAGSWPAEIAEIYILETNANGVYGE